VKLHNFGAVREVTGSMHLVESKNKYRVLLDCGLFQGRRKEAELKNRKPKVDPKTIDAILISHAHVDHCGLLPYFVKKGFNVKIYSTYATFDLVKFLLYDSAYLQKRDIDYINKKRKPGEELLKALYDDKDVDRTMELFKPIDLNETIKLGKDFKIKFYRAGHILGSAMIEIVEDGKKLLFTGDLGRHGAPLIKDPEDVSNIGVDYLLMETTYGNRKHKDFTQGKERIQKAINKIVNTKGKLIIPAFSVGRTQEIVYSIHQLRVDNKIPKNLEVFVDSPLSTNVTNIFKKHSWELDDETQELIKKKADPLGFGTLVYTKKVEQSIALNDKIGPFVIISASGMCEGGRIVHHLKNSIEVSNNIILIVSYQAMNTLGRRLADGIKEVRMFGKEYFVKAEVLTNNEWSAHADSDELFEFAKGINPKKIFLVHGEESQMEAFKNRLSENNLDAVMPSEDNCVFDLE